MKRQYIFSKIFILLLSLLIISSPAMSQSSLDNINKINFASFKTYSEKITKEISIIVSPEYLNKDQIYVSIEGGIFDPDTSRKLTGDRLQLQTQSMLEPEMIFNQPVLIDIEGSFIDHNGRQGVLLSLFFTVYPEDLPGDYETVLVLSDNPDTGERLEIEISLRVEPWLKLETEEIHLIADSSQREKSLISNYPGKLKLFSNVPWELVVEGEENPINHSTELKLKVFKNKTENFEILSDRIFISGRKNSVAAGGPTVFTEKGYTELGFAMIIDDYTKVEAGQIKFPLSFSLESVE